MACFSTHRLAIFCSYNLCVEKSGTAHTIQTSNICTSLDYMNNDLKTCFFLQIGERTATILKHLFPVPKPDSKRIITFANRDDYISFRSIFYYLVFHE